MGEFPGWAMSDGVQDGGKRVLGGSVLARLKDPLWVGGDGWVRVWREREMDNYGEGWN